MSATFQELHVDQLAIHPKNVRRDVGNVVDLANSITAQGILQPLVVAPDLTSGDGSPWTATPSLTATRYVIIAGHRRHAAAKLANVDSLPCIIREDIDTEPKQLEAMLVENTQRTDLTVLEEAEGYQALLEFPGYTVKSVAKATGRAQATIRKRLLLNKLTEDAKGKLEDHTLNVDQALVLVDFADNEEATEALLKAAESGRDWNFTVNAEVRKRDAPAKVEAFEAELKEAGATYLPEKDRYGTAWHRIYENEASTASIEEHVAAGHKVIIDRNWGRLEWYDKPTAAPKVKPELTEAELEAKRRDAQLTAALEIAHAVRAEHIKQVITTPPEGSAEAALQSLLLDNVHAHAALYAEITGRPASPEDGYLGIKAAFEAMTVDQMAILLHLTRKSHEDDMVKLWAWDAGDYRHKWGPKEWIESLGTIYHYELSSVEQEVLDHFQAAHDARQAEIAAEDDEYQEEEDDDAA